MFRKCISRLILVAVAMMEGAPTVLAEEYPFLFRDVGEETGLMPHVAGIRGHGAAWGDMDNNGWPDLFVATFHDAGSKPSMLLRNDEGRFTLDSQEHLRTSGAGSGALFVDLTNDGRLDLYVSNCVSSKEGARANASRLFRNDGSGKFTDVSESSGACPPGYQGRGLAALDFDGDGLLDLITCEQYYSAQVGTGPALYHNRDDLRFKNVAETAGLPVGMGGLGVAAADVNNDDVPDIFLTHGAGEHRLLLGDGMGGFREAEGTREVFRWEVDQESDTPAGVTIADVSRDGLPDIVIGHHFKSPWKNPASVRLYLNRGVTGGVPKFQEITEAAGIQPLEMKAPHVEIQDFDNDGWPDLYVSIVKFKNGKPYPVIYKNMGVRDGIPRFREDAWGVNDFPNAGDRAIGRSGPLFDKILRERKIMYMAAAPSGDFNRDGRVDLFLANWWIESPSLLLRNETPGGNWLQVGVEGRGVGGVNRMGIGAKVKLYAAGQLGNPAALLGCREIAVGYGYCSGQEAIVHLGLGKQEKADLEIVLPHGQGTIARPAVNANQRIIVRQDR